MLDKQGRINVREGTYAKFLGAHNINILFLNLV